MGFDPLNIVGLGVMPRSVGAASVGLSHFFRSVTPGAGIARKPDGDTVVGGKTLRERAAGRSIFVFQRTSIFGGGGAGGFSGNGGGGGGCACLDWMPAVDTPFTIGAAGTPSPKAPGGTTTAQIGDFTISATGGATGADSVSTTNLGGVGTGGTWNFSGGNGTGKGGGGAAGPGGNGGDSSSAGSYTAGNGLPGGGAGGRTNPGSATNGLAGAGPGCASVHTSYSLASPGWIWGTPTVNGSNGSTVGGELGGASGAYDGASNLGGAGGIVIEYLIVFI